MPSFGEAGDERGMSGDEWVLMSREQRLGPFGHSTSLDGTPTTLQRRTGGSPCRLRSAPDWEWSRCCLGDKVG